MSKTRGAIDGTNPPAALHEHRARHRCFRFSARRHGRWFYARATPVGSHWVCGQTVTRGGKPIPMTAKEYALVEFLARNAGRVVGRAEIAEHVWDEEFDPFSNLIEVYVNRVRRKIDGKDAKPLLHTRRGAGYVLSQNDGKTEGRAMDVRGRGDV